MCPKPYKVGAGVSGRFAVQVNEPTLLRRVRKASAVKHGVAERFKAANGYSFDGSTEQFLRLSPISRELIRRDVQTHIEEHSKEWNLCEKQVKYIIPFRKNLILNQGLNNYFNGVIGIGDMTRYCALGTGTATPTTTDTQLATEVKRTGTMLTSSGACGTTYGTSNFVCKRTHDATVETSDVNYSELGWSHASSSGANLNIRVLISGGTVTVLTGQQARIVHELTIECSNTTRQSGTVGVNGWTDTDGEWQWQNLGLSYVDTYGNSTSSGIALFQPSLGHGLCWKVYTNMTLSTWLSAPTHSGNFSNKTNDTIVGLCGWTTYITDSFQRAVVPSTAFTPTIWSSIAIRGFSFGRVRWDYGYVCDEADVLAVRFTNVQTKANTHSLALPCFTFSLTRP